MKTDLMSRLAQTIARALESAETGMLIPARKRNALITDGPFIETKELWGNSGVAEVRRREVSQSGKLRS